MNNLHPTTAALPLMEEYAQIHQRLTELGAQITSILSNGGTVKAPKKKPANAAPKKKYKKRASATEESESHPRMVTDGKPFMKFGDWCVLKGLGYISFSSDQQKYTKYYSQYQAEKKKSGKATIEE